MLKKTYFYKLRFKLFIFLFLIGVISVSAISTFSYINTKEALIDRTFQQLTSVRVIKKRQLESFFIDRINDIRYLAASQNISKSIRQLGEPEESMSLDLLSGKQMLKASAHYSNIYLSNFEKRLSVTEKSSPEGMQSFSFKTLEEQLYLKEIERMISTEGKDYVFKDFAVCDNFPDRMLLLGAPVYCNDSLLGVVAYAIDYNVINEIMLELDSRSGLGKSGESYLVGEDLLMRSSSRFYEDSFLDIKIQTEAAANALSGKEGTDIISDYRNIKVLSSYSPLQTEGLNWVIMAEIDMDEAMIPVISNRNNILLISIVILCFLLPLCFLLSKKITDPITKLDRGMHIVSEGDFDIILDNKSKDEIGSLTTSFNRMTDKLKKQTAGLKEREERLQHFYDATKDGIVLHDKGVPVLFNQALCDITQYTREEIDRMNIDGFLVFKKTEDALDRNKLKLFEALIVKKDQSVLEVEVQETNMEYRKKAITAIVIRDVSKRRKVEKALAKERAERLSSMIDGQEIERQRLSRELHDSLGQSLIAIKLKMESVIDADLNETKSIVAETKELFDATIQEVRRISNDLMPAVLYEFGIKTALSNLCKRVEEIADFKIAFFSNLSSDNYDKKIKTYLYRIAQEALNNCVKHAKASQVKVFLLDNSGHLKLIIKDDGIGFNARKDLGKHGNGILNMRERAQIINASIDIISELNAGTEVIVEV